MRYSAERGHAARRRNEDFRGGSGGGVRKGVSGHGTSEYQAPREHVSGTPGRSNHVSGASGHVTPAEGHARRSGGSEATGGSRRSSLSSMPARDHADEFM
eukprot:3185937-Rhodomonas_salina.3